MEMPKVSPDAPMFCRVLGEKIVMDALPGFVARGTMTVAAADAAKAERTARNFMLRSFVDVICLGVLLNRFLYFI